MACNVKVICARVDDRVLYYEYQVCVMYITIMVIVHGKLCRAWSPVPLPICASHFWSLWNDGLCDVEHFDRLLFVIAR